LDRLRGEFDVQDVLAPAPRPKREQIEEQFSDVLPDDYKQLLGETDGFRIGEWEVCGTRARRVVSSEGNLLVLAENEKALAVKEDAASRIIALYDPIDDASRPIGDSFVDALREAVEGEKERSE
jgi:hypothetical protein